MMSRVKHYFGFFSLLILALLTSYGIIELFRILSIEMIGMLCFGIFLMSILIIVFVISVLLMTASYYEIMEEQK